MAVSLSIQGFKTSVLYVIMEKADKI